MFDAYTVKKVLPRLVIAAILIQLSWPLFTLFISLVSNIAWGIEGLLYAPFGGRDQLEIGQILEGAAGNGTFTLAAALTGAGAVGGVIALGGAGLLSLGITILLALMIGFFVLAIRQVVIVVLLVTAPIALVAWILPGTEKVWKLWWESFSKALFMYPLILLLIAGGRIAAKIAAGNPDAAGDGSINLGNDPFQFAIVLLAFFGPFFLIPKTFQVAGSAFANIAGVANNRSRGVFDRLSKGRQARAADRFKRAQDNHLWNENRRGLGGAVARRANTLASMATSNPWQTANLLAGTNRGKAIGSQIDEAKYKDTLALSKAMGDAGISNDRALRALTGRDDRIGEVKSAKDIQRAIQVLGNSTSAQDKIGASQLQNAYGFLADAHKSEEYGRGSIAGAALMNWSSQGFAEAEDIAAVATEIGGGFGSSVANQATYLGYKTGGRPDQKPSYGVQALTDDDGNAIGFTAGLSTYELGPVQADGTRKRVRRKTGAALEAAIDSQVNLVKGLKSQDLTGAKSSALDQMSDGIVRIVQKGRMPGASEQDKALAESMAQTVTQQASQFSQTDPGSRQKWKAIAASIGADTDAYDREAAARRASGIDGEGGAPTADAGE